ncbi:hypothetical protein [Propionispora vibrioides]|uniref:CRISPR-associated protein Csh1 n=1 Tax=Propionispora vibrioides TaxID=112903 RepID=A0A1H8VRX0_9FIRM|nr:hypothetical protein [Propionispora vibrioides]SEP18141.1 CRISPR-associated protein Csh1 [Propionispora vibrioides]
MIRDLAGGFQQAQQQFPKIIQDNYRLKEGLYIRLELGKSWAEQAADFEKNHLIVARKEEPAASELLPWFICQEYASSLIDMNKPVDPKKQVHGNNPFTLFMKRDVFLGEKEAAKFSVRENIERFLIAAGREAVRQKWLELLPQDKSKSSQGLDFFQDSDYARALAYLDSEERNGLIDQVAQWYDTYLEELTAFIRPLPFKNYVKLFFTVPPVYQNLPSEELYELEYLLYTIPKIFNSNDYNQIGTAGLIGLPSFDMSMNSKKPFLAHKTMRVEAPDRVPLQQALLARKTTEWLAAAKPVYVMNKLGYGSGFVPPAGPVPPEGTFHIYLDGKYNEIYGYENVPFPPQTKLAVDWGNFLQVRNSDGEERYYDALADTAAVHKAISNRFFRGRLGQSFLTNEPEVRAGDFTAQMVALYMQSRQALHDWLYKGTSISLQGLFAKITLRLLVEQLLQVETVRLADLADAFNLRLSIQMVLDEKGGQMMADRIKDTVDSLRAKLVSTGLAVCESDEEFYFTAGQLAYYLVSQSRAQKLTGDKYEPFLRAKNGKQLKQRLQEIYMLYKHEIWVNHVRFNQAFSMVMGYLPETDNRGDAREMLLAGIFAYNLLFEKTDKGAE